MPDPDMHRLALRLKVVEMLRLFAERRKMADPVAVWQRWVCPN